MLTIYTVLTILVIHYIADFILQTDWMALNKSKSNKALLAHVALYSVVFLPFGAIFALVTFILHFTTDYFTSRAVSKLAAKNKRKEMFQMIGLDQLIHGTTLMYSYYILSKFSMLGKLF